jgi:fatty acid desaturase
MKATQVFKPEEIQELVKPSDLRGFLDVGTTWVMIAGCLAACGLWPSVFTIVPAMVLLGGRHLALAILMHDASHYALFRTRRLNDWIGAWLCANPTWQDLKRYRGHHMRHHRFAGSTEDPDLDLIANFPITRASLMRKLARDLFGLSGIKRVYGLLLMEFGFVDYTVSATLRPLPVIPWSWRIAQAWRNMRGLLITNAVLFAILALLGKPWLYGLWVLSWLTTFSAIIRIRSIVEHACTQMDLDPVKNTRTTYANPLARVTVAPHRVNYHLEHHLLMTVPSWKLPRMHRMLKERGALAGAYISKGYIEVLKIASSRA